MSLFFAGLPSGHNVQGVGPWVPGGKIKPLINVIQTRKRSLIFTQELAFSRDEGGFPSENHSR